jgi:hypothetical protein
VVALDLKAERLEVRSLSGGPRVVCTRDDLLRVQSLIPSRRGYSTARRLSPHDAHVNGDNDNDDEPATAVLADRGTAVLSMRLSPSPAQQQDDDGDRDCAVPSGSMRQLATAPFELPHCDPDDADGRFDNAALSPSASVLSLTAKLPLATAKLEQDSSNSALSQGLLTAVHLSPASSPSSGLLTVPYVERKSSNAANVVVDDDDQGSSERGDEEDSSEGASQLTARYIPNVAERASQLTARYLPAVADEEMPSDDMVEFSAGPRQTPDTPVIGSLEQQDASPPPPPRFNLRISTLKKRGRK